MKTIPRRRSGFTLTELAMVLVIVALLLSGLLIPLSTQIDIRNQEAEKKLLAEIREALLGFLIQNGRLPCPASRTQTGVGAGQEMTTGVGPLLECSCTTAGGVIAGAASPPEVCGTSATGVLPWATLGFPESDTWGSRRTYRMTTIFGRGIDPARATNVFGSDTSGNPCVPDSAPQKAAFALCTAGNINVLASGGGTTISSRLPAVIVSHGGRTAGAWTTQGTQISGAVGDELENANSDVTFVSRNDLDDIVVWLPITFISNRMIASGRLP